MTTETNWICVLDKLPEDPYEYVLCLYETGTGEFDTVPPNGGKLQPDVHSVSEHPAPFTGKYKEGHRYNWRVWYWMPIPKLPGEYANEL